MNLRALTSYAEKKYHISEQHLWEAFPGYSVLVHPDTGKWLALLMRGWDSDRGEEREQCDLKCGDLMNEISADFLSAPFRMKGRKWVGIRMDHRTDEEIVFRLFDRAYAAETPVRDTIVLNASPSKSRSDASQKGEQEQFYRDTPLPIRNSAGSYADSQLPAQNPTASYTDSPPSAWNHAGSFTDSPLPIRDRRNASTNKGDPSSSSAVYSPGAIQTSIYENVPDEIPQMRQLYRYGGESMKEKYINFYRQGKFMESYEDDEPWTGAFQRYFPTYHDLNIRQLRGYFTWRAKIRKGQYEPAPASFAYIYLYELLSGIGVSSPEETLLKMKEFDERFPAAVDGGLSLKRNLRRWTLEFCVLKGLPPETARAFADPDLIRKDEALGILKNPDEHSDEELFRALTQMDRKKSFTSPLLKNDAARGMHLIAAVWRQGLKSSPDLFARMFGTMKTFKWHPLANAVYYEEPNMEDTVYLLDGSRSYERRGGEWYEHRYDPLFFDKNLLRDFLRGTDGTLRRVLKTGHPLKMKPEEAWVEQLVLAALEEERKLEQRKRVEAVSIDFTSLTHIREDADITRDALMTEEEAEIAETDPADAEVSPDVPVSEGAGTPSAVQMSENTETPYAITVSENTEAPPAISEPENAGFPKTAPEPSSEFVSDTIDIPGLTPAHIEILKDVLAGKSPRDALASAHLLPSIAVDTINEALWDFVGDNVLECDDDEITLVEDYRGDVDDVLNGN